jgi:hypothetical protein
MSGGFAENVDSTLVYPVRQQACCDPLSSIYKLGVDDKELNEADRAAEFARILSKRTHYTRYISTSTFCHC